MIGTVMDDLKAGMGFDDIRRRWDAKMDPLQYMRPSTPASEGSIKQAEEAFKALGAETSLERRYARLEECEAYWKPSPQDTAQAVAGHGIFGHLRKGPDMPTRVSLPTKTMTWDVFRKEVLPFAATLELKAPRHGGYFGFVTAVHPDAKPILQWDLEGRRNPVSWFYFAYGSLASEWGIAPDAWVAVNAACEKPPMWTDPAKFRHHGEGAYFILEGARLQKDMKGALFFPSCLKAELHHVRGVMEAYSENATLAGRPGATACGYAIAADSNDEVELRVNRQDVYRIDRWK